MGNLDVKSQSARVDLAELLSRLDNDHELLRDLVAIFKEDFPKLVEALQESVAHADMTRARVASHTLKGMLANLAVTRAAAAAGRVEELASGGGGGGAGASIQEALAAFEVEVRGLLTEMETYVTEVQS
jgi:HPt (histidine-containing phosphotransfer) domain-containing protein